MITERAVVGMLLNSHYLNGIVAVGGDARKGLLAEFIICAYTLLLLSHTYVALIYKEWFGVGSEFLNLEFVGFLRIIDLG